jgi:ketosteroid isomerase-like protein
MRLRGFSLLIPCTLVLVWVMATTAFAQSPSSPSVRTAQAVVTTYFRIVNAGLHGAGFAALPTVYAPNATLIVSTPKGVTTVFQGLGPITGWYKGFAAANRGKRLVRESTRMPLPSVVIDYERASTATQPVTARCAHVFVVQQGKIVSDDFIVFYAKK